VVPRHIHSLGSATIQTQCVWAATKLYLGSARHAASVVGELHELLTAYLPAFVASTHMDVSERAALALHMTTFFGAAVEKVGAGAAIKDESLLPVHAESQKNVPIPEHLNLDEPFFAPETVAVEQTEAFSFKADVTDPYSLAASYKDDLGFLAAEEQQRRAAGPVVEKNPQASMYYLGGAAGKDTAVSGDNDANTAGTGLESKADEPKDPLELMKERLAASRAAGGVKYQVNREDVQLAPAPNSVVASSSPAALSSTASSLPVPSEKELAELGGRLWSMCYKDEHIALYFCTKSKNTKKQSLLINLRCEKVLQGVTSTLADITIKLPAGQSALEADASGVLTIHAGELADRSAKVKLNLGMAPFTNPLSGVLACQLQYSLSTPGGGADAQKIVNNIDLGLPPTSFLVPAPMSEDELATYIADNGAVCLNQQTAQALSFSAPGVSVEALAESIPGLMGRCAGLCHFHGIQQSSLGSVPSVAGTPQKYLLVARPPSQGESCMPEGSRVVCLCAALPKADGCLDVRVTVKSCRKEVCDDICAHLGTIFRELVEGRLKA